MEIKVSVPELVSLINEIQVKPGRVFEMVRMNVKEEVGNYLTNLMDSELRHFLGRERYERSEGETKPRNGSYARGFCIKGIGEVGVKIPRDRKGEFQTQVLPRYKQYEDKIAEDLSLMYLTGVSTRTLSLLSKRLIGRKISPTEVSNAHKDLTEAVEKWRMRDLSKEKIKYIFVDGVNFEMRIDGSVENTPVLVAIGVTEEGIKLVIGLQMGDKESASNWLEGIIQGS